MVLNSLLRWLVYIHLLCGWICIKIDLMKDAVDRMADACTSPVHDDEYYGFTVGRPTGWRVDYSTGTLTTGTAGMT